MSEKTSADVSDLGPESTGEATLRYRFPTPERPELISIPIRPDLFVRILGVPCDLSKREADKIAAVVLAMASD